MKNYLSIIPAVIIAAISAQANSASVSGTLQKVFTQGNYFEYDCFNNSGSTDCNQVTTTDFSGEALFYAFNAQWNTSSETLTVDIADITVIDSFVNNYTDNGVASSQTQTAAVVVGFNDLITNFSAHDSVYEGSNEVSLTITFNSAYLIKTSETSSNPSLQINGYNQTFKTYYQFQPNVSEVPVPAAAWLFGSALMGLGLVRRSK